ncbi:MAG: hypothetical protein BJ554DRAFT_5995 [Olpidium bornovanus]|uniref:Kazal-like domain-containing protein n=1 Tax=Olpidium bornovanus TaxID=278681 RepID=A0A8H7ZY94_9FUNG|nr:MAG: hypothetical protein BJ554DRAFT_5995 [Olpidium bornovanus]
MRAAADNSSIELLPLVAGNCCGRRECQAMGFRPVCATSGAVFRNACEAAMAGADPARSIDVPSNASEPLNTACEGPQSVRCTLEFRPVCGETGRTYGNRSEPRDFTSVPELVSAAEQTQGRVSGARAGPQSWRRPGGLAGRAPLKTEK